MKFNKYITMAFAAAIFAAVPACQPEDDFVHPSEIGIPRVDDVTFNVEVDQTTNVATFTMSGKGMPVWIFDDLKENNHSTVNGFQRFYAKAGEYKVRCKVQNANGQSINEVEKTFVINNTLVDFSGYIKQMAGDNSKQWRIASDVVNHLACGEPNTDGTNWWGAKENEKADFGLYDDVLTFSADKKYTYNPGAGGTMYVNKGVTYWSDLNSGEDFMVPVEEKTVDYEFDVVGDFVYIVLPKNTPFPYLPDNAAWDGDLRLRILSIDPKKMELVWSNNDIAWHYTITSGAPAKPAGYDPDHECNLWRTAVIKEITTYYNPDPDWQKESTLSYDFKNGVYTLPIPEQTFNQWQAQFHLVTDLSSNAANVYDFSVALKSSKDIKGATVKLVDASDDNNAIFADQIDLPAFEEVTFIKTAVAGVDAATIKLVFDFGGNPAESEVTISRIVFKDNTCDDGTVIEEELPEVDDVVWSADGGLWGNVKAKTVTTYYNPDPDWQKESSLNYEYKDGVYTIQIPDKTYNQWQAQFGLQQGITLAAGKVYDFKIVLSSSTDIASATVKLTDMDDKDEYVLKSVALPAYEEVTVKGIAFAGQGKECKIALDFAPCDANTIVTVKDIVLQEGFAWATDGGLWGVDKAKIVTTYYNPDPDWQKESTLSYEFKDGAYTVTIPEKTFNQWQAQFGLQQGIILEDGVSYSFKIVLSATTDVPSATVKLTDMDDKSEYVLQSVALPAYEEVTVSGKGFLGNGKECKIALDFAPCDANTVITVKDIILQ